MKQARPLLLSLAIILADQLTKTLVVRHIEENTIGFSCFGDFLRIVHVRNTAVAFSLGTGFDAPVKVVLFILVPLAVMVLLTLFLLSSRGQKELTAIQRWCVAGIIGGGMGNLIDRIFRHFRVVDFISNALYGILGMDRWPTYNLADSAVVVSVLVLLITMLLEQKEKK